MNLKDTVRRCGIKFIFSLISVLLMIPLLIQTETITNYYRTLFIFLINRTIDNFFNDDDETEIFFIIWNFTNQWLEVIVCSFAFCMMISDFQTFLSNQIIFINIAIYAVAVSNLLEEFIILVRKSFKEKRLNKLLNRN